MIYSDLLSTFTDKFSQFELRPKAPAIYALSGSFFYVMVGLCVKKLQGVSATQILFFRCLISMTINFCIIKLGKHDVYPKDKKIFRLLLMRCIFGGLAHICYFQGISYLNLSDAQDIFLTSPIWSCLLASIFLKEPLLPSILFSVMLSFLGILLVIKPPFLISLLRITNQQSPLDNPNLLFGVIVSCAFSVLESLSCLMIRSLSRQVKVTAIVQYTYISGFSLNGLLLVGSGTFNEIVYTKEYFYLLLAVAILNFLAQILYSRGVQLGKQGDVIPLSYSQLVFSFVVDTFILNKELNLLSLIGSSLILFGNYKIISSK